MLLDDHALRALIEQTVAATVERLEADHAKTNGRLAWPEPEAAALLGVARHVLRDCRLRGEIVGAKVGKGVVYSRDELLAFLERQRG